MSNTTITQLSQSAALTGAESFAIDNGFGTFKTNLTSMSVFMDNSGSSYPLTSSVLLGDRIKLKRSASIFTIQPGTAIFKDFPAFGTASAIQVVLGSDSRLSDSRTPLFHSHSINDVILLQNELDNRLLTSSLGNPYGPASLDGFGKILTSQLPSFLGGQVSYVGTWNASSNSPFLSNTFGINQASLVKGNYYVVTNRGTVDFGSGAISYEVDDWVISNGVVWQKVNNTDSIKSIAGKSGSAVTLTAYDIVDAIGQSSSSLVASGVYLSVTEAPTSSLNVVNKTYADTKLSLSGGTMTGNLLITGTNQLGLFDATRFVRGASDSIVFYKDTNYNFGIYDTGDVYVRSKLSVSGSLQTNGNVIVGGVAGSNGVKFPDGTLQTTAAAGTSIVWLTSANFINLSANASTSLTSLPSSTKTVIVECIMTQTDSGNPKSIKLSPSSGSPDIYSLVYDSTNDGARPARCSGQGFFPVLAGSPPSIYSIVTGSTTVFRVIGYI